MLIKNLSFSFPRKLVFADLEMSFPINEITGIVGKNGVGKTTLFRVIKGIYSQSQGEITLDGEALIKDQIGFLPTDPFFYPYMKAGEYLNLVLGEKEKIEDISNLYDLPMDELVHNYSTGMKKKLAFAGITGLNKPIQILDEPFNGVDLQSNLILKKVIAASKLNRVTLVSSHILETLTDLCDQIYFIDDGFKCHCFKRHQYRSLEEKLKLMIEDKMNSFAKE